LQELIVDARWLEPPEPMELTLEAIEHLPANGCLRLLIHRTPHLLFPILHEWGYLYHGTSNDDGSYEILIWRKEQDTPGCGQLPQ
jgi:hypothetical protein